MRTTRRHWTVDEETIFQRLDQAGATHEKIAAALPSRTISAIRRRRTGAVKQYRGGTTKPAAPVSRRIVTLEATIDGALQERKVDWELVDQLLGGLEQLKKRRLAGRER